MLFQPPLHISRLENDQIHRELCGHLAADLERLIELVARRHDDQDIHVAVGVRRAVGERAEEDDPVRPEALRDGARSGG